jgi:hypothetical protein
METLIKAGASAKNLHPTSAAEYAPHGAERSSVMRLQGELPTVMAVKARRAV